MDIAITHTLLALDLPSMEGRVFRCLDLVLWMGMNISRVKLIITPIEPLPQ